MENNPKSTHSETTNTEEFICPVCMCERRFQTGTMVCPFCQRTSAEKSRESITRANIMQEAIRWAKATFISGIIAGILSVICGILGIYYGTHGEIAYLPNGMTVFMIFVFLLSLLTVILGMFYIGSDREEVGKHYHSLGTTGTALGCFGIIVCIIIFFFVSCGCRVLHGLNILHVKKSWFGMDY